MEITGNVNIISVASRAITSSQISPVLLTVAGSSKPGVQIAADGKRLLRCCSNSC